MLGGTKFEFVISGIQNPSSTKPTSTFGIKAFFSLEAKDLVDVDNTLTLQTKPRILSKDTILIEPNSFVVGELTTYQISFVNLNPILYLSKLKLLLPPGLKIPNIEVSQNSFVSISVLSTNTLCTINNQEILISNAFANTVETGQNISFSIGGIKNPLSMEPTTSFHIETMNQEGFLIDARYTSLVVKMN